MSKIEETFQQLERSQAKAFVPYIMAGVNGLAAFKDQLLFLQQAGATMIEVGLPFSDPTADGPTIQAAGQQALKNGITTEKVLTLLQKIKNEITIPLIIMTYFNPVYQYGVKKFVNDLKNAGISGCIIPDLPLEEENIIVPFLNKENIDFIRLVTVTNSEERLKKIVERGKGFLYAVTVTGTTGTQATFHHDFSQFLKRIKQQSSIPVLAGFGISTTDHVKEVSQYCDGVIVGSKIIELFKKKNLESIKQLIIAVHSTETCKNN